MPLTSTGAITAAPRTFASITEVPGSSASQEQLAMLATRYRLAGRAGQDKAVLEVACGSGIGLGYLAERAALTVASDIDRLNLATAAATYGDLPVGPSGFVRHAAEQLPFADKAFDLVLAFEAIYYFRDIPAFLDEARRVLRPGGTLLICSVNCGWVGFNPSRYSDRYVTAPDLGRLLHDHGFENELHLGFREDTQSAAGRVLVTIKRLAVRGRLIPRTMKGKALVKRLLHGPTLRLPRVLIDDSLAISDLAALETASADELRQYKVIYATAKRPQT